MAAPDDILIEESFAQRPMSRALLRRLLGYIRPYRWVFAWNLVLTLLATASQLLGPKFIQIGIDTYLTGAQSSGPALRGILLISGLYLGNLLVGWSMSVAQVRSAIRVGHGAMNDLRQAVFEHIQRLSLSYFDRTHQGRILSRADTDIDSLDRLMTWGANQLLASALTLGGVVLILVQYDARLCAAVSLVLPLLFLATHMFHRRGMRAYRMMREQGSRVTGAIAENIAGVRVVQAFAREEVNLNRFRQIQDAYAQRALGAARIFHTYMPFVGLLSGLGTALILGYGGRLAMQGEITVGELAAFVLYLGMFFGPIQAMGDLYNAVLSTAASAERIFQLLDTEPQIADRPGALELPPIRGRVEFRRVFFRYETTPENDWVLEDIDFEAEPGRIIALVGATGSGKTSVINLLARFYEAQRGGVLVDGRDVREVTLESLHRQIGIVTQDNFLFTGTVLDNLRFGRPGATEDEVRLAAARLGTDEWIRRLAEGYQTRVSERGANFSAGERQLLCFTRAFVVEPRLLILDEATSAVDPQTEAMIQQTLERLLAGRTCFVIAHRLSTVRHAHTILVLDQGRIIERGRHEELLALGGRYARLHAEFIGIDPVRR